MVQQINTCNIKFSKPISPVFEKIIRSLLQLNPDKRELNIENISNNMVNNEDGTDLNASNSKSGLKIIKPTSYRPDFNKNSTGRTNVGFMHLQTNDFSSRSQNGASVQLRSTTTRLLKTDANKNNLLIRSRIAPSTASKLNGTQIKLPSLSQPT